VHNLDSMEALCRALSGRRGERGVNGDPGEWGRTSFNPGPEMPGRPQLGRDPTTSWSSEMYGLA